MPATRQRASLRAKLRGLRPRKLPSNKARGRGLGTVHYDTLRMIVAYFVLFCYKRFPLVDC